MVTRTENPRTPTNKYDKLIFEQGFALIETQSTEKQDCALSLEKLINSMIPSNPVVRILDICGGAGGIWKQIAKAHWEVTLVDQSKSQIEKCQKVPFVKAVQGHVADFIFQTRPGDYHLITCVHGLRALDKTTRQGVVGWLLDQLISDTRVVVVQPNPNNPLSRIKQKLIKKIRGHDPARPSYTDFPHAFVDSIRPQKSTLTIGKQDMLALGCFLTGITSEKRLSTSQKKDVTLILQEHAHYQDGCYVIDILNDYIVLKNKQGSSIM